MSESVGLRERKKRATRVALSEAALRLSVERGYDSVTVEDIASAVDVSTRTFFNYYSSKEEAVMADNEQSAERMCAALLARPAAEGPVTAVSNALLAVLSELGEPSREWAEQVRLVRRTPSLLPRMLTKWAELEQMLTDAIAERTGTDPATSMYPELVAAASIAAARVVGDRWRDDPSSGSLADLISEAMRQLAEGLPKP